MTDPASDHAQDAVTVTSVSPEGVERTRTFRTHTITAEEPITLTARTQADTYVRERRKAGCFIQEKATPTDPPRSTP